ncbi:MAG: class D sortase [Clostridia bacterium]|nr:class D sortase [Clostridia bacterium]
MKHMVYVKVAALLLVVFSVFSFLIIDMKEVYVENMEENIMVKVIEKLENTNEEVVVNTGEIGIIIIPSIDTIAPVHEGTTSAILKYSVGHFENTSLWEGNVVLASHNRGSYAHYFSKINELKNGEEIIYITNMGERRYRVVENKIIDETNVEILESTDENTITLVTCVTGKKSKRRCVIGKEYI